MGEYREKPVRRVPVAEILSGGLPAERKSPRRLPATNQAVRGSHAAPRPIGTAA